MSTENDGLDPIKPDDALRLYLDHRQTELSRNTVQCHRYRLKCFAQCCDEIGLSSLNELTGRHLQEYRLWREENGDLVSVLLEQADVHRSGVRQVVWLHRGGPTGSLRTASHSSHEPRTAAVRSYLAAALLLVYVGAAMDDWYPRSRRDVTAVLAGEIFLVGGTGIGLVAHQFITAGVAAIICSLAPIITAVPAWPLLPAEWLGGRDYAGVLLGFVGIALVIRPGPASLLDPEFVGKLLFLAGVTVVELGAVLVRRSQTSMPIPALTGWMMVLGGTVHVVFATAIGESIASIQPTTLAVAMVVYLSVFIGVFWLVTYLVLMGELGTLKANLTTYPTPIVAPAIGWVLLSERIEPLTLVGFGIIVGELALLRPQLPPHVPDVPGRPAEDRRNSHGVLAITQKSDRRRSAGGRHRPR